MLSHLFIGITDFDRARAFYAPVLAALGLQPKFSDADKGWAGWVGADAPRPLLVIARPFDGRAAQPGNGQMTALLAPDRATVDLVHTIALAHGGACEGPPGLRAHYHPDYYGAYFRDPDGNKLCVCCHTP